MHRTLDEIFTGNYESYFLIAGPCAVESMAVCEEVAGKMIEMTSRLGLPYVFKSSFIKANRTKGSSFRGIDPERALEILQNIGRKSGVAITTDVHESGDVRDVKEVVDLLQIPAFLCRQTPLLQAAGASGRAVNIKKGQFMSGDAMIHAVEKIRDTGNDHVMLTERGNSFGYQDLVVDGRNIAQMASSVITVMDVTHATQRPNQSSGVSGGNPDEVALMGRIGLVSGARGIFMEVHPKPSLAQSDAASMIALSDVKDLLVQWKEVAQTMKRMNG